MSRKHYQTGDSFTAEQISKMTDVEFTEHYGEKCEEYDPYCSCCTAWRIRELERKVAHLEKTCAKFGVVPARVEE